MLYDLVGIGIGPFNLSLAALLYKKNNLKINFLDQKSKFEWHPELMFDDAPMQTSYLKDLVTPVDPKSPFSFLNYLVENGQFYQFVNTGRDVITRLEFEAYMKWVALKLDEILNFSSTVEKVEYLGDKFLIKSRSYELETKNLCIASGPVPNIPECTRSYLGKNIFHSKSKQIQNLSLSNRRVLIVGGGQTGVETFRNVLNDKWGRAESVKLITGRENLQPLDEGPFTNEIFSPDFVSHFYNVKQESKDNFTKSLLLASDGNTPTYLQELYNELYLDKYYKKNFIPYEISPMSWLCDIEKTNSGYNAKIENKLNEKYLTQNFDIIILSTGFCTRLPSFLKGIEDLIEFDEYNRPRVEIDYKFKTKTGENKIYAMNYSRHGHGVADPQTSLMSWRSSVIANKVLKKEIYNNQMNNSSFINYF